MRSAAVLLLCLTLLTGCAAPASEGHEPDAEETVYPAELRLDRSFSKAISVPCGEGFCFVYEEDATVSTARAADGSSPFAWDVHVEWDASQLGLSRLHVALLDENGAALFESTGTSPMDARIARGSIEDGRTYALVVQPTEPGPMGALAMSMTVAPDVR